MFTRGYQGPILESEIIPAIESFQEHTNLILGIKEEDKLDIDIPSGYNFLRLNNTESIDLLHPGPFKMFLPVSVDRVIIDLSKVGDILDGLMFGIRINDENFKGTLLEEAVGSNISILPTKECIAKDNTRKQIDYAFSVEDLLVIVECKLKEMSLGYYKGTKESIDTRTKNVVIKSTKQVDEKAEWLTNHPVGRNYDVSRYRYILPIGLSAFKEFIHTKDKKYWLDSRLPRVITFEELRELKENNINTLLGYWNIVETVT